MWAVKKTAIILFNLGGPDKLDSVEPFLFNLFNDPAIIDAPSPVRWLLARYIAWKRAPIAREIYRNLGGSSPLVGQTQQQADALVELLNHEKSDREYRTFIAMRYWHPMSLAVAEAVRDYAPDDVVLLPLYPQYSSTTTGSSITEWRRAAAMAGLTARTREICCYPANQGWVDAQADLIGDALKKYTGDTKPRIVFSAHGLPKKIIAKGDPYQWQVEQTVDAVVRRLRDMEMPTLSWTLCYQSRVGPLEWIGPSTADELKKAGDEKTPVIVVPIAFVSEHSETLVELDIEYRELAKGWGVADYIRVPAVGTHASFIKGLAGLVGMAVSEQGVGRAIRCDNGARLCPPNHSQCPLTVPP